MAKGANTVLRWKDRRDSTTLKVNAGQLREKQERTQKKLKKLMIPITNLLRSLLSILHYYIFTHDMGYSTGQTVDIINANTMPIN